MALTVEDGSIVPNADSYVSRADLISYAAARGVTLLDDITTDQKAIKAMDYLDLYEANWKGSQVDAATQALAWPRKNVYIIDDELFSQTAIPVQLIRAQKELVMQIAAGVTLLPTLSGETAFITKEKVDVIETEYSEAVALELMGSLPNMPLIDALLAPLFASVQRLRTVRI